MRHVIITVVAMAAGCLGGCNANPENQQHDTVGVEFKTPDKIEGYSNVDQHPNIIRLCIDGVAFATTTRDRQAIFRVPEWDAWCKEPINAR